MDPLDLAASLDAPVGDDQEGSTLEEFVEDPSGGEGFEAVEEWDTLEHLRADIEEAMGSIPAEQRAHPVGPHGAVKGMVSRYELGEVEPGARVIVRLAEFFGVSTDYLLGANSPLSAQWRRHHGDRRAGVKNSGYQAGGGVWKRENPPKSCKDTY